MDNLRRKAHKGFTLIELIIVMAIFSILLMAVISIAQPVSKIFRHADSSEKAYSYSNNIQIYLQNQLEYADNVVIYTEGNLPGETNELARRFVDTYYKDVVTKSKTSLSADKDAAVYMNGKAYVLRLVNHDAVDASGNPLEVDSEGNMIRKGQIYLYTYDFNTRSTNNATPPTDVKQYGVPLSENVPVPQLNDVYFDAGDAKYDFSYVLGTQTEAGAEVPRITRMNLVISITASLRDTAGSIKYKDHPSVSAASIPLTNISSRASSIATSRVIMSRRYARTWDLTDNEWKISLQPGGTDALDSTNVYNTVDPDQDIYFVYAYIDELTE